MGEYTDQYKPLTQQVAIEVLGTSNGQKSNARELRYGTNGSLVVNIAGSREGTWHDFSTGETGDLIDLLIRERGMTFKDAKAYLDQFNGGSPIPAPAVPAVKQTQLKWSQTAESIWSNRDPIAGSIGEDYLNNRGCYLADASEIGFLPESEKYLPSIVARVTDFITGEPLTLHFTRIDPSTLKRDSRVFLKNHTSKNGVVRLRQINALDVPLGLAEGIEDALSVMAYREHGLTNFDAGPVWATLSTSTLQALPPAPAIGDLNIWADNDPAGMEAAKTIEKNWIANTHGVRVMPPSNPHKDWNDDLRAELESRDQSRSDGK